jgi:hypothetical protein
VAVTRPPPEQLLEAAAVLFAERGYHAVGIDDIGAAPASADPASTATSPASRRCSPRSASGRSTRMLDGAQGISAAHGDPRPRSRRSVDLHVAFAVDERRSSAVWGRELPALSDDVRRSLRRRMRAYEQPWQEVLACLRDDLDPAEVGVVTGATLAMLNATAQGTAGVPRDRLTALLRTTALAALLAPAP